MESRLLLIGYWTHHETQEPTVTIKLVKQQRQELLKLNRRHANQWIKHKKRMVLICIHTSKSGESTLEVTRHQVTLLCGYQTITGGHAGKPSSETLKSSSPAADGAWLTAEGVLGRVAESWAGRVVEASSSGASSSVSGGSIFTFRPVALMETSFWTADTTAGAFSDQRETR